MEEVESRSEGDGAVRILLVDDEDHFRQGLARQLSVRGYEVLDAGTAEDAIKLVRHANPEVVVLDYRMPGMDGIEALREIKKIRPEVQVVILTGYGSTDSAVTTGRYGVARYLQKPAELTELIEAIEAAREERVYALARQEIPVVRSKNVLQWLIGATNFRPGVIILGALIIAVLVLMPGPAGLTTMISTPKTGQPGEEIRGYADYAKMKPGETIAEYYWSKAGLGEEAKQPDGTVAKAPADPEAVALRGRVMIGVLIVAALFWGTGAVPVGITALLVGVLMYFFNVFPPELVAKAYAKDAVLFIFGVLSIAAAMGKTGLDRRIAMLLLGTSSSMARLLFIFCPLLALTAGYLSEHALVAFLAPIFVLAYSSTVRAAKIGKDPALATMLLLMLTFVANLGGPGSPAAGGRNAIMLGILADYGGPPTFGEWVMYGLPFVPVAALVMAGYFYLAFRNKVQIRQLDIAARVREESEKIGKMTRDEYVTAGVLILLIVLWSAVSAKYGMGGPVVLCIVLLNILGVLRWRDINNIHWDVVALYAAAGAMGTGLASTGAALWLANSFVDMLPTVLKSGEGLAVATSLITGFLTNFMSDGATVAAVGPITVPMAVASGTPPLMVGLSTAFSSSFAFMFIVGTPNNAICYAMARDPETGEQLLTLGDFLKHGAVALILSWLVLWIWVFHGYWRWIGF